MTERHDHSVETAWKAMLDLEKRFDWLFLWDLQPIEELKRLKTREGDLAGTYEPLLIPTAQKV